MRCARSGRHREVKAMPRLDIDLAANVARLQRDMNRATGIVDKSFRDMQRIAGTVRNLFSFAGVGIGAGSLVSGLRAVIDAAAEAERIDNRLNAVLKATDHAAGLTAKQLREMADGLAEITRFDDEMVKEAMGVLLTFPDVAGDNFQRTIGLAADLSAIMGRDLSSSARLLGKAMQDPVRGIAQLREIGLSLSPVQEDMIRKFDETGQKASAAKVFLDALDRSVGGAAAGENKGLAKSTSDLQKAWGDLLEEFGRTSTFHAASTSFLDEVTENVKALQDRIREFDRLPGWEKFWTLMSPHGMAAFRGLFPREPDLGDAGPVPGWMAGSIEAFDKSQAQRAQQEAERARRIAAQAAADAKRFDLVAKAEFEAHDAQLKSIEARDKQIQQLKDIANPMAVYRRELEQAAIWLEANVIGEREYIVKVQQAEDALKSATAATDDLADTGTDAFDRLEAAARGWGETTADAIVDAFMGAKLSISNIVESIIRDLAHIMVIRNFVMPLFGGLGIPGFANGGTFGGGLALVGERGPELIATGAARVWNADDTQKMLAGGDSAPIVNVNNYGPSPATVSRSRGSDGREIIDVVIGEVEQNILRGGGISRAISLAHGTTRTTAAR